MTDNTTSRFTVNVRELIRSPGAHRDVRVHGHLPDLRTPVAAVDAPVWVEADLASVVEGVLVTGEVATSVELSCVRCLRQFGAELRVPVTELLALDPGEAEDEGYALVDGELLPLDTMARDAIVLAFPAAPLCRADCAGLCPTCGADRNETSCDHGDGVDARWLPLARLAEAGSDDRND
jgi:DUF177 domain-containing protein